MPLVISAGTLGDLAMPDFCPRCFWIKLKLEGKLPFLIPMPGIFSSIDSYVKNVVHRYYEQEQKLPAWFPYIGEVVKPEKVPSWQKFQIVDPQSGVTLRGTPDDVFQLQDSSYHIVDYKTARLTTKQDELFPSYEVQLNVYAYIANRTFFSPVSALTLVYLDPDTDFKLEPDLLSRSESHLMLGFTPKVKSVEIKAGSFIQELVHRANEIYEQDAPPTHTSGCENCQLLENLIRIVTSPPPWF